jgi:hypothetical protein
VHSACGAACALFSPLLSLFTLPERNAWAAVERLPDSTPVESSPDYPTCARQIKRAKCALSGLSGLRADKQASKQRRLFSQDKKPSASLGAPSPPSHFYSWRMECKGNESGKASLCHHSAITLPSLCHHSAITLPSLCHHSAITLASSALHRTKRPERRGHDKTRAERRVDEP